MPIAVNDPWVMLRCSFYTWNTVFDSFSFDFITRILNTFLFAKHYQYFSLFRLACNNARLYESNTVIVLRLLTSNPHTKSKMPSINNAFPVFRHKIVPTPRAKLGFAQVVMLLITTLTKKLLQPVDGQEWIGLRPLLCQYLTALGIKVTLVEWLQRGGLEINDVAHFLLSFGWMNCALLMPKVREQQQLKLVQEDSSMELLVLLPVGAVAKTTAFVLLTLTQSLEMRNC